MASNNKNDSRESGIVRRSLLKATGAGVGGSLASTSLVNPGAALSEDSNWEYQSDVHFVEVGYIHKNAPPRNMHSDPVPQYGIGQKQEKLYLGYDKESIKNKFRENDKIVRANSFHSFPVSVEVNRPKYAIALTRDRRMNPITLTSIVEEYSRPKFSINQNKKEEIQIKADNKSKNIPAGNKDSLELNNKTVTPPSRPPENKKQPSNDNKKKNNTGNEARKNVGEPIEITPVLTVNNLGTVKVYTEEGN